MHFIFIFLLFSFSYIFRLFDIRLNVCVCMCGALSYNHIIIVIRSKLFYLGKRKVNMQYEMNEKGKENPGYCLSLILLIQLK